MLSDKEREAVCSQVARLLRKEREKRGLSLGAVAVKSGLSRQMVSYVEQEKRNPTLDTLLRITGVLEIDLAELINQARRAGPKA